MKFDTCFNCGDTAWIYHGRYGSRVQQATVGQIRIEHTDSTQGYYCDVKEPVKAHKEIYMCDETGIGSGTLFVLGEHIFATKEGCETAFAEHIARQAAEKIAAMEYERGEKLKKEASLRRQLAEIEELKKEAA